MVLCLKIHAYLSLIRLLRSLVPNKGIICMPYKGSKELAYDKALIKKKTVGLVFHNSRETN